MPRSISLGNGKLAVNFDKDYVLRDLFFPHVGQENHLAGDRCLTGIWSNDRFAWTQDEVWERRIEYLEDTLVTDVRLFHPEWGLEVVFNDTVDMDRSIFLRRVTATNHAEETQEVRVFFHYDFHIYGTEVGDTILFEPELRALIAYKSRRYFLANVQNRDGPGVNDWAIGITEIQGREGTWRDAEDGVLSKNSIAQGSVDCTASLALGETAPGHSSTGYHWLAVAETKGEVQFLDQLVRERTPENFVVRTRDWWRAWSRKERTDFADLGSETARLYSRSLLTIRTHVDDGGAIIAATDWDITSFARDTYAYCWPRDGALIALALDKAGFGELSRKFFNFCLQVMDSSEGYFLQKFTARGEFASSWHPWIGADGQPQLPIQEDETGLVLFALWKHYERYRDIEFVKPLYRPLIRAAADFLVAHRSKETGLPLPSYDLWEERRGVHAFTIGAVWAGLTAAASFAQAFNQQGYADGYRQAAVEIRAGAIANLWHRDAGHFSRTLYPKSSSGYNHDTTLDASILALTLYGMLDPQDPRVIATAEAIEDRLRCKTPVGGLARYEGDRYHQVSSDTDEVPGNPWFICTLWLAQYKIIAALSLADLERPRELIRWVEQHALPSGLLAEQLNPINGDALSVSPLTWSHAEFVTTVHAYLEARRRLIR